MSHNSSLYSCLFNFVFLFFVLSAYLYMLIWLMERFLMNPLLLTLSLAQLMARGFKYLLILYWGSMWYRMIDFWASGPTKITIISSQYIWIFIDIRYVSRRSNRLTPSAQQKSRSTKYIKPVVLKLYMYWMYIKYQT